MALRLLRSLASTLHVRLLAAFFVLAVAAAACGSDDPGNSHDPGKAAERSQLAATNETPAPSENVRPQAGGAEVTPSPNEEALLPPDLEILPVREIYIEGVEHERVLRFSTTILNRGPGPLELTGEQDEETGELITTQRVLREDGDFEEELVGRFVYHQGHAHWHIDDFVLLEIWTLDDNGEPDEVVRSTGKRTFCPVDEIPELDDAPPPEYVTCGEDIQGLSPGWSDTYPPEIFGQELELGSLPDGRYALRETIDPDDLLIEADDSNNATTEIIEIMGSTVRVVDEP